MKIFDIAELAAHPRQIVTSEDHAVEPVPALVDLKTSSASSIDIRPPAKPDLRRRMIAEGQRNSALFSLAGSMRRRSMDEEAILAGLRIENQKKCDPPLDENELRDIVESIQRYTAGEPSLQETESSLFPLHALPFTLRRFVEEAAASILCPPEFIALPLLTTLGAAIGNSRVVKVKTGWTEGPAFFSVVVAPPGARKSPAFKQATAAAWEKQADLKRRYDKKVDEYLHKKGHWKEENWKDKGNEEFSPISLREPTMERTVVDDVTVESLIVRLEDNPRGLLCVKDELSGWVRSLDQYKGGKGSDRQFYLSVWSNSSVSVDRKGIKQPIMVSRPLVGLTGSIQPGVLKELKNDREDGLLDRFLFAYPEPVLSTWSDDEISGEATTAYRNLYEKLYDLSMATDKNGNPSPRQIEFTRAGKTTFIEAFDSLRLEANGIGFPEHLKGPWAKMEAYLARLSLILATVRMVEEDGSERVRFGGFLDDPRITEKDVRAAIHLIEYFKAQTCKVHSMLRNGSNNTSDSLGKSLVKFLTDEGGHWDGTTSELYDILKLRKVSDLPGSSGPLGKRVRRIANDESNGLCLQEGYRGSSPIIKLSLPTFGTVGKDRAMTAEGTESKMPASGTVEAANKKLQILEAVERLFENYPEHEHEPDWELIAVELFYWEHLNFIPSEDEVKEALSKRTLMS